MPNTTIQRTMISRPVIAGLAIDQQKVPEDFIGEKIATPYQVDAEDFVYPVFGNEGLEAHDDDLRGLDAEFKEVKIAEAYRAATIDEHGLKARLDRRRIRAAKKADQISGASGANTQGNRLKARVAAVLRMKVLRRKEILIARAATSPATYKALHRRNDVNLSTEPDIRGAIEAAKMIVSGDCGFMPNTAVIGKTAQAQMGLNAQILDSLPNDRIRVPTMEDFKTFFGITNIYDGTALAKQNKAGIARPIWDDVFWLGYVDPTPNSETITFMRNFFMLWENGMVGDVNEIEIGNERFVMMSYAEMYRPTVVGQDCGFLFYDTNQDGV